MHDVTLVISNSLRIKCHIRRPLMSPIFLGIGPTFLRGIRTN